MEDVFGLKGKTVLVTGASSGIGKAIAIECSLKGASVIVTGRNKERLELTHEKLNGTDNSMIVADLNNLEDISRMAKQTTKLDGVVHAAGVNNKSPIKFLNKEKIDEVMWPNFYGPTLLTQALLKGKNLNKSCSIVIISSISAHYATVSNAIYASSKGALNALLRVMALELAGKKIRVNGIQPGMVHTDILDAYELKDELKKFEESIPLKRFGKPEEVAYATVFLLSDASLWITGTSLTIDGGITLR